MEQVSASFSNKWRMFEDVTFSDEEMVFQLKWYISRYGFNSEDDIRRFLESKSYVLDAGCGVGRAVGWFANLAKCQVIGIDVSDSVRIAKRHYGNGKNVHLIQADISYLPFRTGVFDFISCDQVIHHTPEPEEAFHKLLKILRIGGEIAVYVYKKKAPIREFCDNYIREQTTRMSVEDCLRFSRQITDLGKALADLNVKISIVQDIPILGIKAGTYDVQRFFYWYFLKCWWSDEGNYERSLAVNFDWYHPQYAHRFTVCDFKDWFLKRSLTINSISVIENGISIRATRRLGM